MFDTFIQSALLMFIAIDPISLIPIFAGLTSGLTKQQVKSIYIRASIVSLIVLSSFWLFGNAILDAMNISMDSFRIIGGLFLIVIAFQMVFEQRQSRRQNTADTAIDDETIKSIAIFPLSIPLIAGPGAMATCLLLTKDSYDSLAEAFVFYLPIPLIIFLAFIAMWLSSKLASKIGPTILTVLQKIFGLLLGALAIEFVIEGIQNSFNLV
ncbi:MarC family protein [Gammaproteobacteria bacterium]|jgi:multiple antibiotic resistance protein|nr:MarC family protein [Gammaproteobacteria bacterium]MDA7829969.1 MarC family protein [Gammaproteobacteria bacterium]MDA8933843.1 MarC family protein [Gammaproteobacteria bacterium]MDB4135324.1 MarC family protein [Gammaproteobacteria bacterium]MDB9763964.1 MarC family protein [Gammaproteobacteria bacterium]|tara:strand:- start:630 stop:1259 length:630 start_codon:yes stop_codon:yes gene_type:complete